MNEHIQNLFRAVEQVLQSNNYQPDCKLKSALAKSAHSKHLPCQHLYHAWAIAELCCGSPEWTPQTIGAICWPSIKQPLIADILKDLFYALQQVEIPETEGTLYPEIDTRIVLLDFLKRVELAQAQRLGATLCTLDGGMLR